MRNFKHLIMLAALGLLMGCSSGGDESTLAIDPDTEEVNPNTPEPVVVASLEVLTSNPQIPSDGGVPVTITALLRDVNNNFVAGQPVTFSADSGGLSVAQDTTVGGAPQATTDENGRATAELSAAGDPTNRVITVTATSGELTANVLVAVSGTQLTITGPDSLVQGADATYTIVLADAAGNGIANQTIALTSSLSNLLASTNLTTDFTGQAQVQYTALNGGTDNLTASGLGESATSTISISADTFNFTAPAANTEIELDAMQVVTVNWVQNNAPVVGQTVVFSSTRGTITPTSVVTDSNGSASTVIMSENSGPATITATAANGPVTTLPIEFLATTPASLEVQADPFTISPNSQSTITAVLRDPVGNLVKNKRITFTLDDVTGGSLSVSSAVTDSQGRAQTFYTSSATTSRVDGVIITATVDENDMIFDEIFLTVAGREVFFTFGTGNTITEPNEAQYSRLYVVQVTDVDGRAVQNVEVAMSVVSIRYVKGFYLLDDANDVWLGIPRITCEDEDVNRNGFLDMGEDVNGTEQIEAGNIATISPDNFISDALGEGQVTLRYAQQYGGWLEVEIQARASVQGTEFSEKQRFNLSLSADDIQDTENAPPSFAVTVNDFDDSNLNIPMGLTAPTGPDASLLSSPFGYNPSCLEWDFD